MGLQNEQFHPWPVMWSHPRADLMGMETPANRLGELLNPALAVSWARKVRAGQAVTVQEHNAVVASLAAATDILSSPRLVASPADLFQFGVTEDGRPCIMLGQNGLSFEGGDGIYQAMTTQNTPAPATPGGQGPRTAPANGVYRGVREDRGYYPSGAAAVAPPAPQPNTSPPPGRTIMVPEAERRGHWEAARVSLDLLDLRSARWETAEGRDFAPAGLAPLAVIGLVTAVTLAVVVVGDIAARAAVAYGVGRTREEQTGETNRVRIREEVTKAIGVEHERAKVEAYAIRAGYARATGVWPEISPVEAEQNPVVAIRHQEQVAELARQQAANELARRQTVDVTTAVLGVAGIGAGAMLLKNLVDNVMGGAGTIRLVSK